MWQKLFFDGVWLERIFVYVRNVLYCSLILAVGSYTHKNPPAFLQRLPGDPYWGYPLIAFGILLFSLNLAVILNEIWKLKAHSLIKTLLVLLSVYLTSWLVAVIWLFRIR